MGKRADIAETVRQRILREFEPDRQVASVHGLCEEFGVATGTAVAAMGDLMDQGYLYSTHEGYHMAASLPDTEQDDEQRAVVAALRAEARRIAKLADRLERTI